MFLQRLNALIEKQGISKNKFLQELGLGKNSFVNWEKRGNTPKGETLTKIANYFNVTVDYLLGENPAKKKGVKIPVFGTVAAGIPIDAIEDILDYEEITEEEASKGEYFALKIKGHSMEPRIYNGDVVIVRSQPDVDSGDIAIVLVNGDEATCKKIKKTPEGVMLISLNPDYEPMFYSNHDIEALPVTILGKVIELRGKFEKM